MSEPTYIHLGAAVFGWFFCGWLAVGAANADFRGDLGEQYVVPIGLRILLFALGLAGLLTAAACTAEGGKAFNRPRRPFYHGFRWDRQT